MQYKTIVLELLQQYPALHGQLKQQRQALKTMEHLAVELRNNQQNWMESLFHQQPQTAPELLASESLELAIQDLQDRLSAACSPEDEPILTLDQLIAALQQPRFG